MTRAVAPDWPAGWTLSNRISLTVEVELDALGHVSSAQVATRTSEIDPPEAQKIFDDLALRAATSATYLPKIRDCEPVAATYLYRITYDPRG